MLGAAAPVERPGDPVPDDPGAQLSELVGWIAPGQHVEHRLQHQPRQPREGCRPPDQGLQLLDRPIVHGTHRDDVLGEHVERVGGDAERLDRPGAHPLDDDCGLHEVAAELREQHAPRHRPHLVTGPPDPLQAAGHGGGRFDLDDQVDGAHVDAQLEAARGDDRG